MNLKMLEDDWITRKYGKAGAGAEIFKFCSVYSIALNKISNKGPKSPKYYEKGRRRAKHLKYNKRKNLSIRSGRVRLLINLILLLDMLLCKPRRRIRIAKHLKWMIVAHYTPQLRASRRLGRRPTRSGRLGNMNNTFALFISSPKFTLAEFRP